MSEHLEKVTWTIKAWKDYTDWQDSDRKILIKINQIIQDIIRNGNDGIGQAEPLKYELSGFWSRRIDKQNRLVYRINLDKTVEIVSCANHYDKK